MINRLAGKPREFATFILILTLVPGLLLLTTFLGASSEIGNQFLFGLSRVRFGIALVFAFLLLVNISAVLWLNMKVGHSRLNLEQRLSAWINTHLSVITILLSFFALIMGTLLLGMIPPVPNTFNILESVGARLGVFIAWLFLASSLLVVLIRITNQDILAADKIISSFDRYLLLAGIFLVTFFAYEHLLIWMKGANQTRYAYWNLLADEFLRGNLYLRNPPTTHDLTFYKGNWYVPMPPVPALLMMPLAYLVGGENINTSDFSIFLSAWNAILLFLILEQLAMRKWINISCVGMILLVVLVMFGTPHLWVGIRGRAWFVSQVVTVFFLALAVWITLKSWSPWWVGLCIGLAILARPNAIMTWPFVFAIAMQIRHEEQGAVNIRQAFVWAVKSALPLGFAVGGLLLYNFARFENPFDFGYVTISGDATIAANAQTYGMFSTHYIFTNLKAMFYSLPAIQPGNQWPILPSTTGMSIFLTTPPLLYLFHRYERKWWIIGAWSSVFLNFMLLVLYHNTGAHQFGYRYILDAIVPLLAMLAVALGRKIPWHFVVLLLLSIAFNIYGAYWFING